MFRNLVLQILFNKTNVITIDKKPTLYNNIQYINVCNLEGNIVCASDLQMYENACVANTNNVYDYKPIDVFTEKV